MINDGGVALKKCVGVLGGMGPRATIDYMTKVLDHTEATVDQEQVRMIVANETSIPDRIKSIHGQGENIVAYLINTACKLQSAGADFLVMPCNTAHYYYDHIAEKIEIPFLNMIDETVSVIIEKNYRKVVVLGTRATIDTRLYQDKITKHRIDVEEYGEEYQAMIDQIIASVKGRTLDEGISDQLNLFLRELVNCGTEAIVLACTELPVFFKNWQVAIDVIDPTLIIAKKTVLEAGYQLLRE